HRGQQIVAFHGSVVVGIEDITERQDIRVPREAGDAVLAVAAGLIETGEAVGISTGAAVEPIVAASAGQAVAAGTAAQYVGAAVAPKDVVGIARRGVLDR